jgi:hypothetical protein
MNKINKYPWTRISQSQSRSDRTFFAIFADIGIIIFPLGSPCLVYNHMYLIIWDNWPFLEVSDMSEKYRVMSGFLYLGSNLYTDFASYDY